MGEKAENGGFVGACLLAVEEAGLREDEGAGADCEDSGCGFRLFNEEVFEVGWDRIV